MRKTIIQASDVKESLEALAITKANYTIFSIDAVNMYPSVKFSMVERAVDFFSQSLTESEKATIKRCLAMIRYGMGHTLLTFQDQYWEWGGTEDIESRGLTIGGYESAWLADLVAAFILENTEELFASSIFYGIYRDDGLNVLRGRHSQAEISMWLSTFQEKVNSLCGSTHLQFTADVWTPGNPTSTGTYDGISAVCTDSFPYLDTELYWDKNENLAFRVHMKTNQQLKYLNKGSAHTRACMKAIPHGVLNRLGKLTTVSSTNEQMTIDQLYPDHATALRTSNIAPRKFPTIAHLRHLRETNLRRKEETAKTTEKETVTRSRQTYFCIGVSKIWGAPIWLRLKKLRNEHGLKWLRPSISYHRFPNLREKFASDLTTKLMRGIYDNDRKDQSCNCNVVSKRTDGTCMYNGNCRNVNVVYELKDKVTGKAYVGKTQNALKTRTSTHIGDVWQVIFHGNTKYGEDWWGSGGYKRADAFAIHMADECRECTSSNQVRAKLKERLAVRILWKGDPIRCLKSACTLSCRICMEERKEICKRWRECKGLLMNKKSEIYGSCTCKTRFHRLQRRNSNGTDDGHVPENCHDDFPPTEDTSPDYSTIVPAGLPQDPNITRDAGPNLLRAIAVEHSTRTVSRIEVGGTAVEV